MKRKREYETCWTKGLLVIDDPKLQSLEELTEEAWEKLLVLKKDAVSRVRREATAVTKKRPGYDNLSEDEQKKEINDTKRSYEEIHFDSDEDRVVTATCKPRDGVYGKTISGETLSEVRNHADAAHEEIRDLGITLKAAGNLFEVKWSIDNFGTAKLDIECYAPHEFNKEFIAKARHFANTCKQGWFQSQWHAINGIHWMFLVLIIVIAWLVNQAVNSVGQSTQNSQLRATAHELLDSGITESDVPLALETALALMSQYPGKERPPGPSTRGSFALALFFVVIGIIGQVIAAAPRSLIAIGRGVEAIRRQRLWTTFILQTIPSKLFYLTFAALFGEVLRRVYLYFFG